MNYELLEHTADAKFRAYGKNKEAAFANAVKGMTAIITDPEKLAKDREFPVTVTADDNKKLLFDFLDQILFLMDTEHFVPAEADVRIEGNTLTAALRGDDVKKVGGNLKAVTYSEMEITQQDGQWMLQVVVDI
ncbi:MAG: archease [Candidatus Woesearchaeota archaeon]|nr:archease [Candidatus Woesearchaeota archaeon]